MSTAQINKPDFRAPSTSKKQPKAVADGVGGMILAVAEVSGSPERVFRALTTNEVEKGGARPNCTVRKIGTSSGLAG